MNLERIFENVLKESLDSKYPHDTILDAKRILSVVKQQKGKISNISNFLNTLGIDSNQNIIKELESWLHYEYPEYSHNLIDEDGLIEMLCRILWKGWKHPQY